MSENPLGGWYSIFPAMFPRLVVALVFVLGYVYDIKLYNIIQRLRDKARGNELGARRNGQ